MGDICTKSLDGKLQYQLFLLPYIMSSSKLAKNAMGDYCLSEDARAFRQRVQNSANFLESCDGGDAGSPSLPSIWLIGIEPGFSSFDQSQAEQGIQTPSEELKRYAVNLQIGWPFNRNAFKLLAAMDGELPSAYAEFARRKRPFERGCVGYLKANLFPEAFNNIHAWDDDAVFATGFDRKADYQAWLREFRLPVVRSWAEKCRPKLIIGVGLAHLADFLTIAGVNDSPEPHRILVNGYPKRMHFSAAGAAPLIVIPHLSGGPNGLNSNEAIAQTASYIRNQMLQAR